MILNRICDIVTWKKRKSLSNRLSVKKLDTPP